MKQQNSTVYCMIKERKLIVFKFWLARGDVWPNLQKLAKRVFGLVASSAASERNFSTFGFIHSKLRNSLSPEAVEKLVYIKTNKVQYISQHNHVCKNVDDEQSVEMLLGGSDGDNEDESSTAAAMN
jgi:hAT family C-terminal dimerisation region